MFTPHLRLNISTLGFYAHKTLHLKPPTTDNKLSVYSVHTLCRLSSTLLVHGPQYVPNSLK